MTVTPSFLTYVLDQLGELRDVVARRMFGGFGLYLDGTFFGLIDADEVYLRVDDETRDDFVAHGMPAFRPVRSQPERVSNAYYQLPGAVLDDRELLAVWAQRAVTAARRANAPAVQARRAAKPRVRIETPASVTSGRPRRSRTAPSSARTRKPREGRRR